MCRSVTGSVLEEVMMALQGLLDAEELEAVQRIELEGHDVFVDLDEAGPGCRRCKRTAREIRVALESLPGVDHAYVALGPDAPLAA
jgi:metal-sulfur cluster biosynthetic enzyme